MDKNEPLVSILMPVYNGIETLPNAIKSILLQTYSNWKLIIVNDGSTDGTKNYLNELELRETRVKAIHLERNKGRGFSRNVCLQNAESEFVAFLDADDMYFPTKLERQVAYLIENPELSLVGCGVGILEGEGQINFVRGNKFAGRIFTHEKNENLQFMAPTVMFRYLGLTTNFDDRLDIMEDVDFFNRYLEHRKYSTLPDYLYYYSEIGKVSKRKLLKYSLHTIKYYLFFVHEDIKLVFKLIGSIGQFLIKLVLVPIVGVDYFLKRRCRIADKHVKNEMEFFLTKHVIF